MHAIDLRCPSCRQPVAAADVNLNALVARCVRCNQVFAFDATSAALPTPPAERPVPPRPSSITVQGTVENTPLLPDYRSSARAEITPLKISYRWFGALTLFTLVFAIAWNAFLVFWYSIALSADAPWIMIVFPIGHVAVGIGVAKGALAGLLNKTRFELDGAALRATVGPIRWPWQPRAVSVPLSELRQLSTTEKRGQKGSRSYGVVAHLADGTSCMLAEGLPDAQIATFIERSIEIHLGLRDEPWLNT